MRSIPRRWPPNNMVRRNLQEKVEKGNNVLSRNGNTRPGSTLVIPESVRASVENAIGEFGNISNMPSKTSADDHLDLEKSVKRAQLLERYESLNHKKILEIGSGFGTNLAVWIKCYQVDGYGAEPDGVRFGSSFSSSRELFVANGIDPARIYPAKGENLPFEDSSFEIVYSANVLEHTDNPERVLEEAVRVLRPGGLLHFEMPNFLSYFEGHYRFCNHRFCGDRCSQTGYVFWDETRPLLARCGPRSIRYGVGAP